MNEQGFVYFDWNVSSGDASAKCVDKDTIVQNVLSEIGSREEYVVLMHDAGAKTTTVEALPEIIEYLQANDYMILPITANTKPVQENEKAIMQLLLEKQYITSEEWFMAVQYIESGADNE